MIKDITKLLTEMAESIGCDQVSIKLQPNFDGYGPRICLNVIKNIGVKTFNHQHCWTVQEIENLVSDEQVISVFRGEARYLLESAIEDLRRKKHDTGRKTRG